MVKRTEKEEKKEAVAAIIDLVDQNRITNFSDGVFAFAATLLVLKIDLPAVVGDINVALPGALVSLWPQYLANIISFLIIGFYWLNHHAIFGLIRKFDSRIVWLNIIFLISLSFLPFPVDLFGDHNTIPVVVAFYSASLAIVGLLLASIWLYACEKKELIDEKLSARHIRYYSLTFLVPPVVFALAVPLAFIHPLIAQFSWVLVIIGLIIVDKSFKFRRPNEVEKVSGS
ncbi:MAG TPA: TMEM175 family protein [Patescibacteria group bacterium]|nr:TMEM175 family protein [Patescibacteria group bacterium]